MKSLAELRRTFRALSEPHRAQHALRFFRTGPGEYGEGDKFLGITVPHIRKISKQCTALKDQDVLQLLQSPYHEERLLALLIFVSQYKKADLGRRTTIYNHYLKHKKYVNGWDLVDLSAPNIVGNHLLDRDRSVLYKLAKSKQLWDRRIAIMATFTFIKQHQFDDTLAIARLLLQDEQDLIHKAAGWMLREIGNRNLAVEEAFLHQHYRQMPRTMLRYAIEKFAETRRQQYLKGTV